MEGNCGGPPAPPLLLCSRSRSASAGPNSWQHRSAGPKKALSCARPAETLAAAAPDARNWVSYHVIPWRPVGRLHTSLLCPRGVAILFFSAHGLSSWSHEGRGVSPVARRVSGFGCCGGHFRCVARSSSESSPFITLALNKPSPPTRPPRSLRLLKIE